MYIYIVYRYIYIYICIHYIILYHIILYYIILYHMAASGARAQDGVPPRAKARATAFDGTPALDCIISCHIMLYHVLL